MPSDREKNFILYLFIFSSLFFFYSICWGQVTRGSGNSTTYTIGPNDDTLYLPLSREAEGWGTGSTDSINNNFIVLSTAIYNLEVLGSNTNYILISSSGNFIQNRNSLQSGTTFYVASGTVGGTFTSGRIYIGTAAPSALFAVSTYTFIVRADGTIGVGVTTPPLFALHVASIVNTDHSWGYHQNGFRVLTASNTNTFVGLQSGFSDINSTNNSYFGYRAGRANTTALGTTLIGSDAGLSNTTGNFNTFVGRTAGQNNTTGRDLTFMGYEAGLNNTTAINNTYFGLQAGRSQTTGNGNTCVGTTACYTTDGGEVNVAMGYQAGYDLTTGSSNTFMGSQAGRNITTGSRNISIGDMAGPASNESNTVRIGSITATSSLHPWLYGNLATGMVGISCSAPVNMLSVGGGVHFTSTLTVVNDGFFNDQMAITTDTIIANTSLHASRTDNITFTTHVYTAEINRGGSVTNNTAEFQRLGAMRIQSRPSGTAGANNTSNVGLVIEVAGGDRTVSLATQGGNVGLGTFAPDQALDVVGTISQSNQLNCANGLTTDGDGDINGCAASDIRLKKEIRSLDLKNPGMVLDNLRPVFYKWKDPYQRGYGEKAGFIAQEVKKVYPQSIVQAGGDLLGIDSNALIALLVQEVKLLRARVSDLEKNGGKIK